MTEKVKTNLMIFIRSEILRDPSQTAVETNAKYNFIRDIQKGNQGNGISLMPGQSRPMLPPLSSEQIKRQDNADKVVK